MFNEFLPDNYEPPRALGNYCRLQDGDTKLRILSKPIIGWEDWDNNMPIRYKMDQKPDKAKDPKRAIKHFWAMIVWNYNEERIQIWHITQASILRELGQLISDADWGSPFGYDLRINKSGKEMRTKYSVKPLPHKPVSQDIIAAFNAKPCLLEMLFDNQDPFAEWGQRTEGCFGEDKPKVAESAAISAPQLKAIKDLIGDDVTYLSTLEANLLKHFGIKSLKELPKEKYEAVYKSVKLHSDERLKKELGNNDLPF